MDTSDFSQMLMIPAADEQVFAWRGADGVALSARMRPGPRPRVAAPVLLLHGLASNASRWAEFAAASGLTARHDLLRVDLRGHGDSPTLGRIGLEAWGADLLALLDALHAPAGILVGHSLGAQVAMHLAAVAPRRVGAMVLIDPVFRQALRGGTLRRARAGPLFGAAAALVRAGYRLGLHRRHVPPPDLAAMDREARAALAGGPEAEAAFIRHYSSARADLRGFRTAHYLQEMAEMARPAPEPATLAMPVLVLLSTGATSARLEDSRAIAERFPAGTIDTVDCHHWPLTERPDAVRARVEAWIAALPSTTGTPVAA